MATSWLWRASRTSVRHVPTLAFHIIVYALFLRPVAAQAPANDVISWPAGLLLLASVLYAALGQHCDSLWLVDPSIGLFLGRGVPTFSVGPMRRIYWINSPCHFIPNIRSAHGMSNFWIRSNEITEAARAEAFRKTSSVLNCVTYGAFSQPADGSWDLTSAGLVAPANWNAETPSVKPATNVPTGRDFLLFAATDYHVFREWEVNIYRGPELVFSTKDMPRSSIVDVNSEERALAVVAAQMIRRPFSQTTLRDRAKNLATDPNQAAGPFTLDLVNVDLDSPVCAIDFHSYSAEDAKVSASLRELARAYYCVAEHIRQQSEAQAVPETNAGRLATINVGQTLWIAILGGALLDTGRVTIQNLPGRRGVMNASADEAYIERVQVVLEAIKPYANTPKFSDLVFSGGTSRRPTYAFLLAGLCGQMIIAYFLSVGTSAGVWTSVVITNSLYTGRLTDWHSVYFGRTDNTLEPGLKMYNPDSPSKEIMVVATLDRTSPRGTQGGGLSPGFLLNLTGLVAAVFGAVFQKQTRHSLGFGHLSPTPNWVVYTSIVLALGTSLLIVILCLLQQWRERTWFGVAETPTRWAIYSTISTSLIVCGLAAFFTRCQLSRLWPVLDALVWVSGFPLGILENGRLISMDDNMLHLVLLNRWVMGAVSSAVGSGLSGGLNAVC